MAPQGTLQNAWTRYIQEGRNMRDDSQKQIEAFAKRLVQEGELRTDQVQAAVDDIQKRSMAGIRNLEKRIRAELKTEIGRIGVVTRADIEKLEKRIAKVEKSVTEAKKAPATRAGASRATTAKSTASKSASARTSSTTRRTAAKKTGSTTPED